MIKTELDALRERAYLQNGFRWYWNYFEKRYELIEITTGLIVRAKEMEANMYIKCQCGHDVLATSIKMYADGSLKLSGRCDVCLRHVVALRAPDPVLSTDKGT